MPKKPPRGPKFNLDGVREITSGKQAKGRKAHNQGRPAPGEIREAKSAPPERDRLDRAVIRAHEAQKIQHDASQEGKPRPGEVLYAERKGEEEKAEKEQTRRFLELARERFQLASEATNRLRADAIDDLEFRAGKQWPKDVENARTMDNRPCLTINRMPQFLRQVTNEQRQQRPSIQVNPVGDGADLDTAEVLQGGTRHIEVISDAEIAYDTAFDYCVSIGFGFWRIITDYIDSKSFDQEILIKRVKNPFCIYFDPAAIEPDYSDARFAFVIEDMPRSEYEQTYKDSEAAALNDFSSIGDNAAEWASKEAIRVAEYFHVEEDTYTMVQLEDGRVCRESEIPEGAAVKNKRECTDRRVVWSKINALEILDERDWPGQWIPIVPVLGDDFDINGERHLAGMVRHAKDAQRMYNVWVSAGTEMIALAPKAPFVGAEGQFEGHEKEWESANVRNLAKLEYKPKSLGGELLPPPQRQIFEPPIQSINLMTRQADSDLKATMGIFDPTLGQNKQDQSGRAISLLQKQADISNLNFLDNLSRSIRHTGRILLDLIPKIYDAPRVQRIIKPDQSSDHVIIHNGQPEAAELLAFQSSIKRIYDIGTGRYDVTVTVGPSYQSRRQESVAAQMALVSAYPQVFALIGDLLLRNMDWPGAKEMADRLKRALAPQLQDPEDQDEDPETKMARMQSQMSALSQQHELLVQALNKANEVIQGKQLEAQNKLDVERIRTEAQITLAEINKQTTVTVEQIRAAIKGYNMLHDSAHETAMQAVEHGHQATMQENAPAPGSAQ